MANGDRPNKKDPVATVIITYVDVILVHGQNLTFGSHLILIGGGGKGISTV